MDLRKTIEETLEEIIGVNEIENLDKSDPNNPVSHDGGRSKFDYRKIGVKPLALAMGSMSIGVPPTHQKDLPQDRAV